jgi:SAM-dependent MidA family methyltransferase
LVGELLQKIVRDGPLAFPDFMAAALYDPTHGYYARGIRQVGRGGDFFTSVSVGTLFGALLARRFLREWRRLGSPQRWRVIECGAHDGTLAADILTTLEALAPPAFDALEYVISEPLPGLQAAQRETLARFAGRTRLINGAEVLAGEPLPGIAFGNELLDALPFHVVCWKSGGWRECRVAADGRGGFAWDESRLPDAVDLIEVLDLLGKDFPENYWTEVRTGYRAFLEPLLRGLSTGLLLWPDYGFARPEYYHPDRAAGTLRTFSKHRAAENPFESPGEIDITAHVDFTAVAEAAMELGCQPLVFRHQGSWLTEIGREWLLSLEGNPDPEALRQFRTLTHPAHLGGAFHVLELAWNQPTAEIPALERHRLALRACSPASGR